MKPYSASAFRESRDSGNEKIGWGFSAFSVCYSTTFAVWHQYSERIGPKSTSLTPIRTELKSVKDLPTLNHRSLRSTIAFISFSSGQRAKGQGRRAKSEGQRARGALRFALTALLFAGNGGGQGRDRTADAGLFRAALYQLSYLARGEKKSVQYRNRAQKCQTTAEKCAFRKFVDG